MASLAALLFAKSAGGLLPRRAFCAVAANASGAAPAAAGAENKDAASVVLRGTVERVLTAGPKHCVFTVRTSVLKQGLERPLRFEHNVKAFGAQADAANAVAKVGSRVQVLGMLKYERRLRNKPAGEDNSNPYRCVIEAESVKADN